MSQPSSSPLVAASGGPLLPRAFGKYLLVERIGQGGMAEIFVARTRTELGAERQVVVKLILPAFASLPRFEEMLIAEAKLAARLRHANVVQVLDLGRLDEQLYIAMEYVEGIDLAEVLKRCSRTRTPLPIDFGLLVVIEVLRALDHAHRRTGDDGKPLGIVHRDVSPSNVLVSFEGEVKLCDFGIAHAADAAHSARQTEELQGKAGYMSPEHARGEPLDARADVFAAGVLLWETLAGRRYYRAAEGESLIAVARRAETQPLPPRDVTAEDTLRAIVSRALATRVEDRFPSAQSMLRELENYVAEARLIASQLRLGAWMRETIAGEVLEDRRARQHAAKLTEARFVAHADPAAAVARDAPHAPDAGGTPSLPARPRSRAWRPMGAAVVGAVLAAVLGLAWLYLRRRAS